MTAGPLDDVGEDLYQEPADRPWSRLGQWYHRPGRKSLLLGFGALCFAAAALIGNATSSALTHALASRGRTVEATVTHIGYRHPDGLDGATLRYLVDGRTVAADPGTTDHLPNLKVGEMVAVVYDPTAPSQMLLQSQLGPVSRENYGYIAVAALLAAGGCFAWWFTVRSSDRRAPRSRWEVTALGLRGRWRSDQRTSSTSSAAPPKTPNTGLPSTLAQLVALSVAGLVYIAILFVPTVWRWHGQIQYGRLLAIPVMLTVFPLTLACFDRQNRNSRRASARVHLSNPTSDRRNYRAEHAAPRIEFRTQLRTEPSTAVGRALLLLGQLMFACLLVLTLRQQLAGEGTMKFFFPLIVTAGSLAVVGQLFGGRSSR